MNVKDLRVGNWVAYANHPTILKEYWGTFREIAIEDLSMLQFYEPIPLSEEILIRCGFEKVKSYYEEAETFDYFLYPLYFDMANTSIKINGVYQKINYPEYLHQLQNLYYSLTGQEITLK